MSLDAVAENGMPSPVEISPEEIKNITLNEFIAQIAKVDELRQFVSTCLENIKDHKLFEKVFMYFLIDAYCLILSNWVDFEEKCCELFKSRLQQYRFHVESFHFIARHLSLYSDLQDKVENVGSLVRKVFLAAIEEKNALFAKRKPAMIDTMLTKRKVHEVFADMKKNSLSPGSPKDKKQRISNNPYFNTPTDRLFAVSTVNENGIERVFQVTITKCLSDSHVYVQDAFPTSATVKKWKVPVTNVIDYVSKATEPVFVGDRVYSLVEIDGEFSSEFYPGSILALSGEHLMVLFDDGDTLQVPRIHAIRHSK